MLPGIALAALAAAAVAPPPAPAGFALEMAGQVPTVCRVEARLDSGVLEEYCNAPRGYAVYAEPSRGLAGAVLVVDGAELPLSPTGPTLISGSDHAAIATRSLELRGAAGPGTLTFRIVPL